MIYFIRRLFSLSVREMGVLYNWRFHSFSNRYYITLAGLLRRLIDRCPAGGLLQFRQGTCNCSYSKAGAADDIKGHWKKVKVFKDEVEEQVEADLAANKGREKGERYGHGGSDEKRVVRLFHRPRKSRKQDDQLLFRASFWKANWQVGIQMAQLQIFFY